MTDTLRLTTADGMDIRLQVAGVGSRSYAFIADWHLRILFVLAWLLWIFLAFEQDEIAGFLDALDSGLSFIAYLMILPPILFYLLYHPILEILMRGRTPGKRLAGVRIVTTDGRTPSMGAILVRNLFRLVDSLPSFYLVGLAVALATARHVRIGDLAAGTMLVHESKVKAESLATAQRLALAETLPPADQALLLDLVERWRSLRRKVRIDLGQRFLAKAGETNLPPQASDAALDRDLFARLSALAGRPSKRTDGGSDGSP